VKNVQKFLPWLLISLLLGLLLSGCGTKDPLVGTWVEPVSGIYLTFDDSGKVLVGMQETFYTMQYEKKDPDILVITVSSTGTIPNITASYKIDEAKDQLILTVNGVDTLFNRKK
jgi:hypothetical protein